MACERPEITERILAHGLRTTPQHGAGLSPS